MFSAEQGDPRLRSGLADWWVPRASGVVVPDYADRQNGTLVGGASPTLTPFGLPAVEFNGTTGYLNTPRYINAAFGGALSVALWMRIDPGTANYSMFVAWGDNGTAGLNCNTWTNGRPLFVGQTTNAGPQLATDERTGLWHHYVFVSDGTNGTIYQDGRLAAGPTSFGGCPVTGGWYPVTFGSRMGGEYYATGAIADVRLYNRMLSAAEIALLADPARRAAMPVRRHLRVVPPVAKADAETLSLTLGEDDVAAVTERAKVDTETLLTLTEVDAASVATWTLRTAGVERAIEVPSLQWQDQLNARSSLSFDLITPASGGYRPIDGESCTLTDADGSTVIFPGQLEEPAEELLFGGDCLTHNRHRCRAVSYDALADKTMVAASYTAQTLRAIAQDIVATTSLAAAGVTATDYVDVGPTLTVTFNYKSAAVCFAQLCEESGFSWWIDVNKKLHMQPRVSIVAPFAMSDAAPHCSWLRVSRRKTNYRNVQYVRAGIELTSLRTESFVGDGTRKVFTLAYPVGVVPTQITVNAVPKPIGIRGVETGKDWYWNKGATEIQQDDGASALTSGQTLAVTYRGQYPIVVAARNESAIAARVAIEGGTGEYVHVDDDPNINSGSVALDKANALLARYGVIEDVVEWETDDGGLRAGQLMSMSFTKHAISGEYLIESVSARARDDIHCTLVYTVRALSGDGVGGWLSFFQTLLDARRSFVVRENEVLLVLRAFADGLVLGDSLGVSLAAPESRIGASVIGFSEIAA